MMRFFIRLLLALAVMVSAPSHAEWHEAKSKHFIIYSEGRLRDLEEYATKLERFDKAVRIARNMEDPPLGEGGRLTIYVLEDAKAVAAMVGRANVAGYYVPRASGSIAFAHRDRETLAEWMKNINENLPASKRYVPVDPETVFFHEYFHHLMLGDANSALPKWIVEGFAEYFSTAAFESDGSVILGRPAAHRSAALFSSDRVPLEEMLTGTTRKLSDDEVSQFYGRGWLLTHYLSTQGRRSGQLQRYLQSVQDGKSSIDAARQAFGDLRALNADLQRYLTSRDMAGYRVPASLLRIDSIQLRSLGPAESAMMSVRMKSDNGVTDKTAPGVAAQARAIGAKYPNDAFVQGALAETEYDAGNFAAAIAAADRALAVKPNDLQALIYKGRALMAQADAAPGKADWTNIRSWFVRANKLDPEYAEPLMLYYQSFAAVGARAPDTAVDGLLYAVLLAPQDGGLRTSAVRELLTRERVAEARPLFAPIAYDPHATATWRERNQKVMGAITAGKAKDALALLNAPSPEATQSSPEGS